MSTECIHCGFNNPTHMRFCGNCGARMDGIEVSSVHAASYSPSDLGSSSLIGSDLAKRLRQAGINSTGQRRRVTVLFADLCRFTDISAQLDPEDVYEFVREFLALLINDVYKYEGIVDKLTGDGLMALFGAPITHENNAERAVRAAIDMQSDVGHLSQEFDNRYGLKLKMRLGLHSGAVIVGGIGTNLLMDYTAIGDTVNLANRIEEAADPGSILVSETVFQQTKPIFVYQPIEKLRLKGISAPITAYRLLGLKRAPGPVRGIEGANTPLVGREQELDQLSQAVGNLIHNGQGQFILLTGEAGIGKSRLVRELTSQIDPTVVQILMGHSLTYRRSVSYWIFLEILRSYIGTHPEAPGEEISRVLNEKVHQATGKGASEIIPYLQHLLSMGPVNPIEDDRIKYLDASTLQQQIFLSVRDLLVAEANRRPLILILEDLHWADEASLELLAFILYSVCKNPILILAVSRPDQGGIIERISEKARNKIPDHFQSIRLPELSYAQTQYLLNKLLVIPYIPRHFSELILQKSGGIPFYLEEILRNLIDNHIIEERDGEWTLNQDGESIDLGVPDSLQGLILARFDRLDEFSRNVLQVASVTGHQFDVALLAQLFREDERSLIEETLEALVNREFLIKQSDRPLVSYEFRHVLMSEAIYSTILKRERSRLHGEVGHSIEILYKERLHEQVELLARHYSWSPQQDKALHYLILAGQKAADSYINEQARDHFEHALELLEAVDHTLEQAVQVQRGLGDVLTLIGEYKQAHRYYQSAVKLIKQENSKPHQQDLGILYRKMAKIHERQGDYTQALDCLGIAQKALSEGQESQSVERSQIISDIGWIHYRQGNFSEAEILFLEALELVKDSHAYDAIASILNRLGGIAYSQGDWKRTADFLRKSIAIRESIGDVVGLATSFNNLGLLEIEMGEFDNALENLTHSYELKTRLGQTEGIAMTLNNLGWLQIQRGELDKAKGSLEEALQLAQQIGYSSLTAYVLKNLGELLLADAKYDQANQALQDSSEILADLGILDQRMDNYRLLGEAALGQDDIPTALDWERKALNISTELEDTTRELATVQRGELLRFRGMLACHREDWISSQKYLRESKMIFQHLGSRFYQGRVAYQLGRLAELQGDQASSIRRYQEAVLHFQSVGARREENRSEKALLCNEPVEKPRETM